MHSCIDGYYTLDESTTKTKLTALSKVMKGALSVSKSKTGETITRDNRLVRNQLGGKILQVTRERTLAFIDNDHKKRVFSRRYKSTLKFARKEPPKVSHLKRRYQDLRASIQARADTMAFIRRPNFKIDHMTEEDVDKDSDSDIDVISSKHFFTPREPSTLRPGKEESTDRRPPRDTLPEKRRQKIKEHLLTKPERDLIKAARLENQKQEELQERIVDEHVEVKVPSTWREKTFDMTGIKDLLDLQKQTQEKLAIRIKLERYKFQKETNRRLAEEKYSTGLDQVGRSYTPSAASGSRGNSAVATRLNRMGATGLSVNKQGELVPGDLGEYHLDEQNRGKGTVSRNGRPRDLDKTSIEIQSQMYVQTNSRSVSFVRDT